MQGVKHRHAGIEAAVPELGDEPDIARVDDFVPAEDEQFAVGIDMMDAQQRRAGSAPRLTSHRHQRRARRGERDHAVEPVAPHVLGANGEDQLPAESHADAHETLDQHLPALLGQPDRRRPFIVGQRRGTRINVFMSNRRPHRHQLIVLHNTPCNVEVAYLVDILHLQHVSARGARRADAVFIVLDDKHVHRRELQPGDAWLYISGSGFAFTTSSFDTMNSRY